jgi:hypothetical protein
MIKSAPRPTIRYRSERLRAGVAKAAPKPSCRPNTPADFSTWAWDAAKARGYDDAHWQALAAASSALRNVVAVLHPHRLPPPGSPWPEAVRARFASLVDPKRATR